MMGIGPTLAREERALSLSTVGGGEKYPAEERMTAKRHGLKPMMP